VASSAAKSEEVSDTRARLIDAAVALFIRNSVAGTSLQMIADELGVTKAAIFYHFPNREQLLLAVMEPYLEQIRETVHAAERRRSAAARADAMIRGYAALSARNRELGTVLAFDAHVTKVLSEHDEWSSLIRRQLALLVGDTSDRSATIKAHAVFRGLAGAATAAPDDMDEDELRGHLTDVGRRMWGLRATRRRSAPDPQPMSRSGGTDD
jgi:AcrR family transcriptional regulator